MSPLFRSWDPYALNAWCWRPLRWACATAFVWPVCAGLAPAQSLDLPGWELFWHDEFDGSTLDTTKWEALDRRDSFNNEKQYYHPDQVTIADGNLQLTAIDTPRAGKAYQSGLITSRDLFGPGRFEARVHLPTSQGMWPAFWLNANNVPWPQGGEIDILENRGSQPNVVSSAYHWQTDPGPCCDQHEFTYDEYFEIVDGVPTDFHSGFHTYAAEWDDTSIHFFVDGNLYHTVTETPDRPILETPKNIIVNLAVGGIFGGDPDATTVWPQTMLVDYVRVWQPEGSVVETNLSDNLLINPGFDDAGGSLDGWDDFGNTIPNVSADNAIRSNGSHSLKIFGQFSGGANESGVAQSVAISEGASLVAEASTYTPSWDTLFGKTNSVRMAIEFFDSFGAAAGSAASLGEVSQVIHSGVTSQDTWHDHLLEAVAPEGAVEARLSFTFDQPGVDNGAIWIDGVGLFVDLTLGGDFNDDGVVDTADYTVWRNNIGQPAGTLANDTDGGEIGVAQYQTWRANFGRTAAPGAPAAAPVPEPLALAIALVGVLVVQPRRLRNRPR